MRQSEGRHPTAPVIGRAGENAIGIARRISAVCVNIVKRTPDLINIAPPRAGGRVNRHPLLVPSQRRPRRLPGRPAVSRAQQVAGKRVRVGNAKVIKNPVNVRRQNRVAAKRPWLQIAGKSPVQPAIGGIGHTGLPEIAVGGIKLSPAHGHAIGIGGINAKRRLVRRVANDVLIGGVDINLVARAVRSGKCLRRQARYTPTQQAQGKQAMASANCVHERLRPDGGCEDAKTDSLPQPELSPLSHCFPKIPSPSRARAGRRFPRGRSVFAGP